MGLIFCGIDIYSAGLSVCDKAYIKEVSKKKLKKVADAGFIPGIYNYCDRWCEKCDQRLHCMSFVIGRKLEEKGGLDLDEEVLHEDESIWAKLKSVFESTYEVLCEVAQERGIDVEDIYTSEKIDREFWGEEFEHEDIKNERLKPLVENSDVVRICLIYENLADKCLEKVYEIFDDREKEAGNSQADEALEVIDWYMDLISSKIRRAMYGFSCIKEGGKEEEDYNGSAKVAIIAVERSIAGWEVIRDKCPACQRDISHLLIVLHQLLEDTEQQFPNARVFLRPGFEVVAG